MNALLIDFEGVLRIGNEPAPYINDFFNFIKKKNIPSCIVSNSTLLAAKEIKNFLISNNIEANIPILTTVDSAVNYVKENYKTASIYCTSGVKHLFNDIEDAENPEAIVIGDLRDNINTDIMNEMFNKVYSGADIIALHKNRFWKSPGKGLVLDAGAYITALEYATGKKAILIGKPEPLYFINALKRIGKNVADGFLMLGDDLDTDIHGAQKLGATTILILTGKSTVEDVENSNYVPHYIFTNLNETIIALNK